MIQLQLASAKIYQFPVGGRGGQRALSEAQRAPISATATNQGSAVAVSESWYHAEAIQAAEEATS